MPRKFRGHHPSSPSPHETPLDQEEQEFVDDFLQLGGGGGELSNFMELDGFITALVVVPGPQMPASWHGFIFGGANEEEVLTRLFAAETRGILALVLRHWRTVRRRALATERWSLPEDHEDTCFRESGWAQGFLQGIDATQDEWEGQMTRARCEELLAPVRRIAELPLLEASMRGVLLPALSEEKHAALERELVLAVGEFYMVCRRRKSA